MLTDFQFKTVTITLNQITCNSPTSPTDNPDELSIICAVDGKSQNLTNGNYPSMTFGTTYQINQTFTIKKSFVAVFSDNDGSGKPAAGNLIGTMGITNNNFPCKTVFAENEMVFACNGSNYSLSYTITTEK